MPKELAVELVPKDSHDCHLATVVERCGLWFASNSHGKLLKPLWGQGSCEQAALMAADGAILNVFDCPHSAHSRQQFRSLFQDADGAVQSFMWHRNQKAVCYC